MRKIHTLISTTAFAFAIFGLTGSLTACKTSGDSEWVLENGGAEKAESIRTATDQRALTGTHKLCSIVVSGNWRDTILVPDAWSSGMCVSFMGSLGGTSAQLGCVTNAGFSWGTGSGVSPGIPATNCGW